MTACVVNHKDNQMNTPTQCFSSSITPDRLKHAHANVFSPAPPWVIVCESADESLPLDEAKMVVRLGGSYPESYSLPAISLAILFELTRFGNTVLVDANNPDTAKALYYLTFKPSASAKDTISVNRIIAGAGPHQAVRTPKQLPTDLTPDNLAIKNAGKPTKDARLVAMRYAEERARDHAGAAVEAYLNNLRALFACHDDLLGVQPL
jgi:hypothetical protein